MAINVDAESFAIAADQGARFLIKNQNRDGLIYDRFILNNYKSPLALTKTGYFREANRLLAGIKTLQTSPGQYHFGDENNNLLRSSTYRNAFILLSAILNSRFDLANEDAINDFISYQTSFGAFRGEQNFDPKAYLNTNHTGLAGLLCIHAGLNNEARLAADFILAHLANQPEIDERFYIHTDGKGKLITRDVEPFWLAIDYKLTHGHYWAIGMASFFLSTLFLYTSETVFMEGAKKLIELTNRFNPKFKGWPSSGKVAWGAANIYAITRDIKFMEIAETIGEKCLLSSQTPSGAWEPFFFQMGTNEAGYTLTQFELTAEFTFLCSELARLLT